MTYKKGDPPPVDPKIYQLVAGYQHDPEAILEILRDLQAQHGILAREAISEVARDLRIPIASAFGVASFYSMLSLSQQEANTIKICDSPVCWLKGADKIRQAIEKELAGAPKWTIERTSCLGLCDRAPAVLVNHEQAGPITDDHIADLQVDWRGQIPDYTQPRPGEVRVMMAQAGKVNPDSIESALTHGTYQGLRAALSRTPDSVVAEVEVSGLTGRGGAGFLVGRKWRFVAQANHTPKYIICNADESEPLIFKDRVLIDTNPHQILEGMAIAGYATGASEGFIYIRGEYPTQAARLQNAIEQAEKMGWLGNNIQESNFSFHIHIHRGAGAYICGEETALIESMEGKRGEPRLRPPYPPTYGYGGMPTLVNNVESIAAVPSILSNGATWYRSLSTYPTPGTKLYILLGHINQPGLFEVPFGLTLRKAISEFGGGMKTGSTYYFALTGGAAGTIVPGSLLDIPIDYSSASKGVSLGAGAFLICDQTVSPVELLREIMHFFAAESCGKCTPCRVGTYRSLEILTHMASGLGKPGDYQELIRLADVMQDASFCGLGQSVAIPMKSAMIHFPELFQTKEMR